MKDPLEGKTLKYILTKMVERYGFEELSKSLLFDCFIHDPSIKSSLVFFRRTPWARTKVEKFYIKNMKEIEGEEKGEDKDEKPV